MEALTSWRVQFLAARGLSEPDGRSLFEYHITANEYEKLQSVLQAVYVFFLKKTGRPLSAAVQSNFFPEYFILYAAEWWRKNYAGTGFSWEPLLASIGALTPDWSPSARAECVTKGLSAWNVPLNDTYGMQYIGSIAVQAGLPENLLTKSGGKIASILLRILRLALDQHDIDFIAIREWVESLGSDLPQTYRKATTYILLARIITTILSLKREAELTAASTAIQTLDQRIPNWRNRFPLPINDNSFRDLLASLMREAVSFKPAAKEKQAFSIHRELRLSADGVWNLMSSCRFSQKPFVRPESIVSEIDQSKLPQTIDMTIVANMVPHVIPMRKISDQEYRATNIPWEWDGTSAAAEHIVRFTSPAGQYWNATAPQGETLQDDLPWIFSCQESQHDFLGQRGGAFVDREVLLAIPEGWSIDAEAMADTGAIPSLGRKVVRFSGTGKVLAPYAVFRFKTASAESLDEYYEWSGRRLWDIAVSPQLIFMGKPSLYSSHNGMRQNQIPDRSIYFKYPGRDFTQGQAGVGIVDAAYKNGDETIFTTKLCLLPDSARVVLQPESVSAGFIKLENWGVVAATSKTYGVEVASRPADGTLVLHCRTQEGRAPEWIDLDLLWSSSTSKARIRLPFPAKGARLFSSDGSEIVPGSLLCSNQLHGLRLQAIKGSVHSIVDMEWLLGAEGTITPLDFSDTTMRTEIRLLDHKGIVSRLFSVEDSLDAKIRLSVRQDGRECAFWKLARYNADIEKAHDEVILHVEHMQKLTVDELGTIKAIALSLATTGSEPEELPQVKSEGVPTGSWFFNPVHREPGLWIIYPPNDGVSFFRPTCWYIEGEISSYDRLIQAILIQERAERHEQLRVMVDALASDYGLQEWQTIDWLAMHLGHLPLVALDLWSAFSRNPAGMAALLLRYSGAVKFDGFLSRYSEEFPFMWETISLIQWKRSTELLKKQVERDFQDTGALSSFWLQKRVDEVCSLAPSLSWLLRYIILEVQNNVSDEMQDLMSLPEAACMRLLADRQQELLRRHEDDNMWPEEFSYPVATVRRLAEYLPYLLTPDSKYHDSVLNAPVVLAINVMRGDTERYTRRSLQRDLRKHYNFDPLWFEEAFSWTFARCLISGQLGVPSHE